MTHKMLIAATAKFLLKMIGFYFATLVVLAVTFPEVDKYQIILFSWLSGALVALYAQPANLLRN